jgi:hypothetical protein
MSLSSSTSDFNVCTLCTFIQYNYGHADVSHSEWIVAGWSFCSTGNTNTSNNNVTIPRIVRLFCVL